MAVRGEPASTKFKRRRGKMEDNQYRFMMNNRKNLSFTDCDKYYKSDPDFHAMVDALYKYIDKMQLSPSEVRAAAMYACYRHEMFTVKPIMRF